MSTDNPTETTSLLNHKRSSQLPQSLHGWFKKRVSSYDQDKQSLVKENTGIRVWSESYSSIDWIHDRIKEGIRKRKLQNVPGYRGQLVKIWDDSQAWVLVILIGTVVASIAWFIDVIQEWMSDLKLGYCSTNWRMNSHFCCLDHHGETCHAWRTWPDVFGLQQDISTSYYISFFMYTVIGLLFSLIAAVMVKYTGEKVTVPAKVMPFSKSPSMASIPIMDTDNKQQFLPEAINETKTVYYSAGSGIPEVKVILGGFVIKGFLGIKTLIVKSIGMVFSTSAGLTAGKEGPFVHLACSAGNIACRLFPKYNHNESKKREILSASVAAGVAVAFGAPIGGVLFSLEEVSYYFPMKTMIRSYCCAMIAAVVLKITDPFGTGKIVLFQVSYDKDYHLFELVPLIMCGAFAGLLGAFVTYFNIQYQHIRKTTFLRNYPITEVLCIMLVTSLVSFWNPFARMGLSKFAAHLFSECSLNDNNGGLCAYVVAEIPHLLYLLITTLIIKMGLTMVTFGCAVPGGVFLPTFIIGALVGRIIGLVMQYLTLTYSNAWPFTACAEDLVTRGECVIPGVYAIVGAAAGLAGVTRSTISLVVIMFELTYSLTYALPIMVAVMVAKWVADAMFIEGIYDLLIELKGYPYLESRKEYVHKMTITEVAECFVPTIRLDEPMTISRLKHKLSILTSMGYGEDGGFPILSNDDTLEGYIAVTEITHGLEKLEEALRSVCSGKEEINETCCYFNKRDPEQIQIVPLYHQNTNTTENDIEAIVQQQDQPLNDFSQYVDYAPLMINHNASMTLLVDMFTKLGAQYVCVTHSNGGYQGIIHKRRLLAYLKELEEEEHTSNIVKS